MSKPVDFVASVFIVKEGKTLLVKHKQLGIWLQPGGHIEDNELPDEAAIREAKEETGLDIMLLGEIDQRGSDESTRVLILPDHVQVEQIDQHHRHFDLIYVGVPVGGKVELNNTESEELRWFSKEDLDDPEIRPNISHFGKKAIDTAKACKS